MSSTSRDVQCNQTGVADVRTRADGCLARDGLWAQRQTSDEQRAGLKRRLVRACWERAWGVERWRGVGEGRRGRGGGVVQRSGVQCSAARG